MKFFSFIRRLFNHPPLRRQWFICVYTFMLTLFPWIGTLGYEGCFLLTAPFSFLGVFVGVDAIRTLGSTTSSITMLKDASKLIFSELARLLAFSLIILLLAQLWQTNCEPMMGLAYFFLGPVLSAFLGSICGLWGGVLAQRRWQQISLALLPLCFCLGISLWRLYADPVVFAMDPFWGVFWGPIYDEAVAITPTYLWFRGYNLLVAAAALIGFHLWTSPLSTTKSHALTTRIATYPWLTLGTIFSISGSLWIGFEADRYGFTTSVQSLRQALPATITTEHFVIHYAPRSETSRDIELVAAEHEFAWSLLAHKLQRTPPAPIHSFIFPNPQSKRRLFGAGHVEVASPWRGHIYLNHQPFPHQVLHHELAHAFEATIGDPIFGLSARLSIHGLHLNLALVEGVAEALAPRAQDGLDLHDQAAILERLKLRPSLATIMGLGFWGNAPGRAYTAAGSFCLWLLENYSVDALIKFYQTAGDTQAAYETTLTDLEQKWLDFLASRNIRPEDMEILRQRFKKQPIFQRPCAHRAANLIQDAHHSQSVGQTEQALQSLQTLCAIEPENPSHYLELAVAQAQAEHFSQAVQTLHEAANLPQLTDTLRVIMEQHLGDLALLQNDFKTADEYFSAALARSMSESQRRSLQIRQWAAKDPTLVPWVIAYFQPFEANMNDYSRGIHQLYAAMHMADAGYPALSEYLLGRQLLNTLDGKNAAKHLEQSLQTPESTSSPELIRATRLALVEASIRIRDYGRASEVLSDLLAEANIGNGHRLTYEQWQARIAFYRQYRP